MEVDGEAGSIAAPMTKRKDTDGVAQTEADYFEKCPACGEWFDTRDISQMLVHVHDPNIEIETGPEPPPHGGKPQ